MSLFLLHDIVPCMNITVIGTGFVGVVTAAVYASFGHNVIGLDVDEKKIASLKQGLVPFFEPGLSELLLQQQQEGHLKFTTSYNEAIPPAEIVVIAVGTPSDENGAVNLTYLHSAIDSLAPLLQNNAIVAIKSTVPPGTLTTVAQRIKDKAQVGFRMAALPEFLREGTAVEDTLKPDRVVIGTDDQSAFEVLAALHQPFKAPILKLNPESAHMAKYASNAYLANRITFINQIADLCTASGANIQEVISAIGLDKRIGSHYWYPGFGYGGSCFPKDVSELSTYAQSQNLPENLFTYLDSLNRNRIPKLLEYYGSKIGGWQDKQVAVLGLSFKPQTNDMREAPSVHLIPELLKHNARVKGYDPQALDTAPLFIADHPALSFSASVTEAVTGADVIIALIEWPEIIKYDFSQVRDSSKEQWFIDARNQFDPAVVKAWGFNYMGVGQ